eukprot:4404321-Amphidinium_carterae.1
MAERRSPYSRLLWWELKGVSVGSGPLPKVLIVHNIRRTHNAARSPQTQEEECRRRKGICPWFPVLAGTVLRSGSVITQ